MEDLNSLSWVKSWLSGGSRDVEESADDSATTLRTSRDELDTSFSNTLEVQGDSKPQSQHQDKSISSTVASIPCETEENSNSVLCRFCLTDLGSVSIVPKETEVPFIHFIFGDESDRQIPLLHPVCNDCTSLANTVCWNSLPCGHFCPLPSNHSQYDWEYGVSHEEFASQCRNATCVSERLRRVETNGKAEANDNDLKETIDLDITDDDDCPICYTDHLRMGPQIHLACGHIFHLSCFVKLLQSSQSPRLSYFTRALCPTCHQFIELKASTRVQKITTVQSAMQSLREEMIDLHFRVKQQLARDHVLVDKSVVERYKEKFTTNPEMAEVMAVLDQGDRRYNFYRCYECKNPYFGGRHECGDASEDIPESEFVCGGCQGCTTHGVDHMVWKCRYCCRIAIWHCFGHTHFCEECHNEAFAWIARNDRCVKRELNICQGKDTCPLGVDHPPNGEEHALGCGMCGDFKVTGDNAKRVLSFPLPPQYRAPPRARRRWRPRPVQIMRQQDADMLDQLNHPAAVGAAQHFDLFADDAVANFGRIWGLNQYQPMPQQERKEQDVLDELVHPGALNMAVNFDLFAEDAPAKFRRIWEVNRAQLPRRRAFRANNGLLSEVDEVEEALELAYEFDAFAEDAPFQFSKIWKIVDEANDPTIEVWDIFERNFEAGNEMEADTELMDMDLTSDMMNWDIEDPCPFFFDGECADIMRRFLHSSTMMPEEDQDEYMYIHGLFSDEECEYPMGYHYSNEEEEDENDLVEMDIGNLFEVMEDEHDSHFMGYQYLLKMEEEDEENAVEMNTGSLVDMTEYHHSHFTEQT